MKEKTLLEKEHQSQREDHSKEMSKAISLASVHQEKITEQKFHETFVQYQSELQEANRKLRELSAQFADSENNLRELREIHESMRTRMTEEIAEKVELLDKETAEKFEMQKILERTQNEHQRLQKLLDDVTPREKSGSIRAGSIRIKRSVLSELTAELASKYNNDSSKNQAVSAVIQDFKVKEEFFHLTASALKVRLSLKDKTEYAFMVPMKDLVEEAIKEAVPFHEWYPWLKKRILARVDVMKKEEEARDQEELQKLRKQQEEENKKKSHTVTTKKSATTKEASKKNVEVDYFVHVLPTNFI